MKCKPVAGIMLTLLLVSMLALAFKIQPVKAEPKTWTVDDDGPADFHTIQEGLNSAYDGDIIYVYSGTYNENPEVRFLDNLTLQGEDRQNTIINGSIRIKANSVTIENFQILGGVSFPDWRLGGMRMTNNIVRSGISLRGGGHEVKNNILEGGLTLMGYAVAERGWHVVENNTFYGSGIVMTAVSCYNSITHNTITNASIGISEEPPYAGQGAHNSITENMLLNCNVGVKISRAGEGPAFEFSYTRILGNTFERNDIAVFLAQCSKVTVYHNNFINNTIQAYIDQPHNNTWDDDYPSGGNYWSDYDGVDKKRGPNQHKGGSDGIGDTQYVIDENNEDRYPLMNPWTAPDIAVINVTLSKSIIGQGFTLQINATVTNQGNKIEAFNVTAYANKTVIQTESIILRSERSETITFTWNTTSVSVGNYIINTTVTPLPSETDTDDNTYVSGEVVITITGDVNGDFSVETSDLLALSKVYGCTPEEPNWNANCDFNMDALVDASDLFYLSRNYGKTCMHAPPQVMRARITKPENTTYSTATIPVKLNATGGTIDEIWYNCMNGSEWIYESNQTYTVPTNMVDFINGTYQFFGWANNTDGNGDAENVNFTVSIPAIIHGGDWEQLSNMTYGRQYASIATVGSKLYVIGGRAGTGDDDAYARYNYVEEYDIINDSWVTKTAMPEVRDAMWTGVVNDAIYVIGGYPGSHSRKVRAYYPSNDSWGTLKTNKPNGGWDGNAVVLTDAIGNDVIYCLGGSTDANVQKWVEVYCPNNDTWITKTPMKYGRAKFGAAVHDGKIYVFGSNWFSWHNYAEVYDPDTNTWSDITSSPLGAYDYTLGENSFNGRIYLVDYNRETWYYNPVNDTYAQLDNFPYEQYAMPYDIVEINGIAYVAGGDKDIGGSMYKQKTLFAFAYQGFYELTLGSTPTMHA